jgi:catechol 2,3-dioxygenase-like lactoylglutathione lyase family enzyme
MITKMNHACIYVLDQDSAYDFYVNKLGFKVHTDAPMGPGKRWLTVTPPEQPDLEVILSAVQPGMGFNDETAEQMKNLIKSGAFGFAVWACKDLNATYEEMIAKGVEFIKPPTKEFYAYEALFKDDSGNWFSLTEKP